MDNGLSKKEQIKVRHEMEKARSNKERNMGLWAVVGIVVLILGIGGFWIASRANRSAGPLPGQEVVNLGQDHVGSIADIAYNSNPPTSGPHFAIWAKKGVYDNVISDGHLIHSLEHGYIVTSYNCGTKGTNGASVKYSKDDPLSKAGFTPEKDQMAAFTPQNAPKFETELPEEFTSDSCKALVKDLSGFLDEYERVIIVPRPSLDSTIALTAWTRIDKMEQVDSSRIRAFMAAFHNAGPEKTVE